MIVFKGLDKSIQMRVKKRLGLLETLRPTRTLKKHPNVWVLEIGELRVLYLVDSKEKTKTVFFIGNHKYYEKKYFQMFEK